jgi:hypothetical protein
MLCARITEAATALSTAGNAIATWHALFPFETLARANSASLAPQGAPMPRAKSAPEQRGSRAQPKHAQLHTVPTAAARAQTDPHEAQTAKPLAVAQPAAAPTARRKRGQRKEEQAEHIARSGVEGLTIGDDATRERCARATWQRSRQHATCQLAGSLQHGETVLRTALPPCPATAHLRVVRAALAAAPVPPSLTLRNWRALL